MRTLFLTALLASTGVPALTQEIANGLVTVRAVKDEGSFAGFDVLAKGKTAAAVRLSSGRILSATRCEVPAGGRSLRFAGLVPKEGTGLALGEKDEVRVDLRPDNPYPAVSFDLTIREFDPGKWRAAVGQEPFHFLALHLPEAEAWHQRGWLNATPLSDPFPLLLDRHVGTPEISAYHYNRSWSYTPPLGAQPIPVIGLWAPRSGRYLGLEFQTTRLSDNSEKDIATGYRWVEGGAGGGQFVALVYPHGGTGYQELVFPKPGSRIRSRGTLLWSLDLPSTGDPNRFFWSYLWEREKERLPGVPEVPDVSWIPGGIRRGDFEGPPHGGLIGGVERPFQIDGSKVLSGWTWHNESPTAAPKARGDARRLKELEEEAGRLLGYAKRFSVDGEECVFWEKPLEGRWTEEWGGKPATTLHNANGFAAGRLFLGLHRDLGKVEHLPVVDGVLNWAKKIAWTRNEFADVPSSPFAIGGTLSASFCLEYWMTFRDSPIERRRKEARAALDLARSFTYRYLTLWPSDSNRADSLDTSFLWEPNSGRDWCGAACANEVFWNLDTLAQTAVHTGDPVLLWAIAGSLSRWHALYQDVWRDSLADYGPADMTEGLGLYEGNIYGVGSRASYGFAAPLVMTEPIGGSALRVVAGEKAALAFKKGPDRLRISGYRYKAPGNLSFTLESSRPGIDLSLTVPYVDLSAKPVAIVRGGKKTELRPGADFLRPPQALWSLYLKDLKGSDRVVVGEPDEDGPVLPSAPPNAGGLPAKLDPVDGFEIVDFARDGFPERSWARLSSWAGAPQGLIWIHGIPFSIQEGVATKPIELGKAIRDDRALFILYEDGEGPPPAVLLEGGGKIELRSECLAWGAWPPIYTARLLLAQASGKGATGIDPRKRPIWGVTALGTGLPGTSRSLEEAGARLIEASKAWRGTKAAEERLGALREEVAKVPEGSIAILPPRASGPAFALANRTGLLKRAAVIGPERLVDPGSFSAKRFPVALYLDGEDYIHTVRSPGDGAEALVRYVKEGGALVFLASGPWPLFYADGPGFHRVEPLTDRLGLPLFMAIEEAPEGRPEVQVTSGQSLVKSTARVFPYPAGDPRLRSIDRKRIPGGARYTPIATVTGASGKDLGDAGGLIELAAGGGRILYLSGNLLRGEEHGPSFLEGALRFILEAARKR